MKKRPATKTDKNFYLIALALSVLLCGPFLFGLSHYAQSPDGAEMVQIARYGGFLHPSGMPLQALINRVTAWLTGNTPSAWPLSFISWLGTLSACFLLCLCLNTLAITPWQWIFTLIFFVAHPVVWQMSVVPEKYAWMMSLELLVLFFMNALVKNPLGRGLTLGLGLSLGLALAQHTALVVLVFPCFWLLFSVRKKFSLPWQVPLESLILAAAVTLLFYASLYFSLSERPWPNWGAVQTVADWWRFVTRADFSGIDLLSAPPAHGVWRSGWASLWPQLSWKTGALLFIPLGLWTLYRRRSLVTVPWILSLICGLLLLNKAALPAIDAATVLGYQERYPLLVWPLLTLFWALGLQWFLVAIKNAQFRIASLLLLTLGLSHFAWASWQVNRWDDDNLVQLYREEVAKELPPEAIFLSDSDFVTFMGVPAVSGERFPLKNLFGLSWYTLRAAPQIEPRVVSLFPQLKSDAKLPQDLVRLALQHGWTVAVTGAAAFLNDPDLMNQAEQVGLLWLFRPRVASLYSSLILQNCQRMCESLSRTEGGVPLEGRYFVQELLSSFHYAFLGVADYLASQYGEPRAAPAREVAARLVPGSSSEQWQQACRLFLR